MFSTEGQGGESRGRYQGPHPPNSENVTKIIMNKYSYTADAIRYEHSSKTDTFHEPTTNEPHVLTILNNWYRHEYGIAGVFRIKIRALVHRFSNCAYLTRYNNTFLRPKNHLNYKLFLVYGLVSCCLPPPLRPVTRFVSGGVS